MTIPDQTLRKTRERFSIDSLSFFFIFLFFKALVLRHRRRRHTLKPRVEPLFRVAMDCNKCFALQIPKHNFKIFTAHGDVAAKKKLDL
jgi:hypothetical protein